MAKLLPTKFLGKLLTSDRREVKIKTLAIAFLFEATAAAVAAGVGYAQLAYFSTVFVAFNVFGLALAVLMTPRLPPRRQRPSAPTG